MREDSQHLAFGIVVGRSLRSLPPVGAFYYRYVRVWLWRWTWLWRWPR